MDLGLARAGEKAFAPVELRPHAEHPTPNFYQTDRTKCVGEGERLSRQ
jgi:hypothetical protein